MKNEQNTKTPSEGQLWYRNVYLKSEHWRDLRARVLAAQGHHCLGCSATTNLQVHHIVYSKLYAEKVDEMMVLCHECHKRTHELWERSPKKYTCQQIKTALRHYLGGKRGEERQDSKLVKERNRHNYNKLPPSLRHHIACLKRALKKKNKRKG